ncbi:baculoviral IAP repeat-containing protein 5.2-A-like [Haliotis cracherodii]|uniref:baculoviral IAP repeat-containing protein 5.2-A-like n=1 Tax=Haliotis cracherodii TaxID=6455 RepID=UPI0039EBE76A
MDVCGRFDDVVPDCAKADLCTEVYGQKFSDRLKTFDKWPLQMKQSPTSMAKAGFIYTGQSDKAYCFKCKLHVHRWIPEDDPMTEHFRLSPHCSYIHMVDEPQSSKQERDTYQRLMSELEEEQKKKKMTANRIANQNHRTPAPPQTANESEDDNTSTRDGRDENKPANNNDFLLRVPDHLL